MSDETLGEPAGLIVFFELQERDRRLGQAVMISCSFRDRPMLLNADEDSDGVIPAWAEREFRQAVRAFKTPPASQGPMPPGRDAPPATLMVFAAPSLTISGFGWPFVATSSYYAIDTTAQQSGQNFTIRTNTLPMPKSLATRLHTREDSFAISAVWPGFAINTLFYATLFAIPAPLVLWLTRRRRHRLGHCTNCNYNLTGLALGAPCPECGTLRRANPSPTPQSTPAAPPPHP